MKISQIRNWEALNLENRPNIFKVNGYNRESMGIKINSNLEGSVAPIDFEALNEATDVLAKHMLDDGFHSDLIIGLAGRGIVPAYCLAQKLSLPLQIAYKNRLDLPNELIVYEEHSKSNKLYFYIDECFLGKEICIVDDEVTSGRTFENIHTVLNSNNFKANTFVSYIEHTKAGIERLRKKGIVLYTLFEI